MVELDPGNRVRPQRGLGPGPDPTLVLPGAIWTLEAVVAGPRAACRKSREFCDTAASPGFSGVSVSLNSVAKPRTFATSFATRGPRHQLEPVCLSRLPSNGP